MKRTTRTHYTLITLMTLFSFMTVAATQANAESSLLIQLNEQLNQETKQVRNNLMQLKTTSSHQQLASEWAEKVRSLPKGSKDYAHARAQYAHAVASDLEQKFETVTQLQQAATAMADTIDRLVDARARSGNKSKALISSQDSVETIQAKANQLKGLNNMFVGLINADSSMQNTKLRQSYRVFQLELQNAKLQASIPRGQGINSLQRLKDSSESIAFLARAYLNGLKHQTDIIGIVSIAGEANMVNRQAEGVMADAFDVLNPDGQAMKDMQFMLGSIEDSSVESAYHIDANPSLSNDIDALAAKLISQKQ